MASLQPTTVTAVLEPSTLSWKETRFDTFQKEDVWKPHHAITQARTQGVSLGSLLVGGLFTSTAITFLVFCIAIYQPIPWISAKFALFLTMLFGGLSLELLYAKKLRKNG